MGSFAGHILPGSFLLLFGIWWTFAVLDRYFKYLISSASRECSLHTTNNQSRHFRNHHRHRRSKLSSREATENGHNQYQYSPVSTGADQLIPNGGPAAAPLLDTHLQLQSDSSPSHRAKTSSSKSSGNHRQQNGGPKSANAAQSSSINAPHHQSSSSSKRLPRWSSVEYRNTPTYNMVPCSGVPSERPIEGYVKVGACTVGILAEYFTGFDASGHFVHYGNAQHITMFLFFALNGLSDIAATRRGIPLPRGLSYLTLAAAIFVEGLLFTFHLHGRAPLDVHLHQLLIIAIGLCLAVFCMEWACPTSALVAFLRCHVTLLQGTWFYQVAFVLYPPSAAFGSWDFESHMQIMMITAIFCWHIAAIAVFILGVGAVQYYARGIRRQIEAARLMKHHHHRGQGRGSESKFALYSGDDSNADSDEEDDDQDDGDTNKLLLLCKDSEISELDCCLDELRGLDNTTDLQRPQLAESRIT